MIVTRRGMLIGAAAASAIARIGAQPWDGVADTIDINWRSLVPAGADVLVLAPAQSRVADDAAAELHQRPGRTMLHRVTPLARGSFAELATMINRARGMHVVALADTAELLVIGTLLQRVGAVRQLAAGGSDLLVARL